MTQQLMEKPKDAERARVAIAGARPVQTMDADAHHPSGGISAVAAYAARQMGGGPGAVVYDDVAQRTARRALVQRSASPGSAVVQRQVTQQMNGKWVSDLDPTLEFDTQQEAIDFELQMEPPEEYTGGRASTLFTHTATKSHRKMSTRGIPQGPHTVGYSASKAALEGTKGKIDIKHLISEQVIDPDRWRDLVKGEFGADIFNGKTEMSLRVLRAYKDYNGLFQELRRVGTGESQVDPYDLVEEMMQLHPYAVYKATNPDSVSKKHLKGKGENSDLSDPRNIDTNAKFKHRDRYAEMVEDRLLMLDEDYVPENDGSGSDSEIDEEHKSNSDSDS